MGCASWSQPDGPIIVAVPENSWDAKKFERVANALAEQCPLNAPVRLTVRKIPSYWGYTAWNEAGYYEIHIAGGQPMYALLDTLVHEWAHAMVYDAAQHPDMDLHGPLWGVAWARAYRALTSTYGQRGPERRHPRHNPLWHRFCPPD